jgi:16S rRNA (guanine(966)-N(2))-methyltransferase RsmD
VKETLFNILMHDVPGAVVLDLFCGAGTLGLEAISRGAKSVLFVDLSPKSLKKTMENVKIVGAESESGFLRAEAMAALKTTGKRDMRFTLIIADPPYGEGWPAKILRAVADSSARAVEGTLVIEHHKKDDVGETPPRFSLWTTRRFGDTVLSFWRWDDRRRPSEQEES